MPPPIFSYTYSSLWLSLADLEGSGKLPETAGLPFEPFLETEHSDLDNFFYFILRKSIRMCTLGHYHSYFEILFTFRIQGTDTHVYTCSFCVMVMVDLGGGWWWWVTVRMFVGDYIMMLDDHGISVWFLMIIDDYGEEEDEKRDLIMPVWHEEANSHGGFTAHFCQIEVNAFHLYVGNSCIGCIILLSCSFARFCHPQRPKQAIVMNLCTRHSCRKLETPWSWVANFDQQASKPRWAKC